MRVTRNDKKNLNSISQFSLVSKDTFLTFLPTFWALIRKEDNLVERVFYALSEPNLKTHIDFMRFKMFY